MIVIVVAVVIVEVVIVVVAVVVIVVVVVVVVVFVMVAIVVTVMVIVAVNATAKKVTIARTIPKQKVKDELGKHPEHMHHSLMPEPQRDYQLLRTPKTMKK